MKMQKSKNELITKFEYLEKEMETVSNKYDSKLMEIDKKIVKQQEDVIDEINESDIEDINISTEEVIELFVEMYEAIHAKTDLTSVLNDFKKEHTEKLAESGTSTEKEYVIVMHEMDIETAKIENQMYNVAKAFLN